MKWRGVPLGAIGLWLILGINIWLLTVIVSEVMFDDTSGGDKVAWNAGLSASAGDVASRKPIQAYRQILERPIFFKSRAPFVPAPPPPPPVQVSAPAPMITDPGLALGGVMIKSNVRKAYVFSRAGANGAWSSEGDEFMGWQIKSINGAGAKLEQRGRSIDLRLYPKE
jgi:hypothetical protein